MMKTCVTYVSLRDRAAAEEALSSLQGPARPARHRVVSFTEGTGGVPKARARAKRRPGTVSLAAGPRAPLTVAVLDSGRGCAAQGVPISLSMRAENSDNWLPLEDGVTNSDGCVAMLYNVTLPHSATYRLEVDSAAYNASSSQHGFCQHIQTTFRLSKATEHHRVSIHLSPAGYSLHLG